MKKRFIIYGAVGWLAETVFTGLSSLLKGDLAMYAFTYIWMFPIYGSLIFLEPVHDRIRKLPVLVRGCIYMGLIFAAEYATGGLLRALIGKCPWDYGTEPYSINGLIKLSFIPVWFVGGLAFERLHDYLIQEGIGETR